MLELSQVHYHLVAIVLLFLGTWLPVLKCREFVSDDHDGIQKYDYRYDPQKDELSDKYEENGKVWGKLQFNPSIPFPGSVIRWLRLQIGKKFTLLGKNKLGHEVYGYVQSPVRHHLLSLVLQLVNVLLTYFFLSKAFNPEVALFASLLFSIHPVSNQTTAWCSGIGYLIAYFGIVVTMNLVVYLPVNEWTAMAVASSSFIASLGLLPGAFMFLPLLELGHPFQATICGLVGVFALAKYGSEVVNFRKEQFKKQEMGASTRASLGKIVLVFKTLYYYICMLVFPNRLGLFHAWGYHYTLPLRRVDFMFWKGVLSFGAMAALYYYGPPEVRFGLVWFLAFFLIFLNVITAQQFVADRYAFIPSLGFCLVISHYLIDYPIAIAFILGVYACRSRRMIKTYTNEINYYISNRWEFPSSEVALANLGVAYGQTGKTGSAVDCWLDALKINPHYAVPNYNLFSAFRGAGDLQRARHFLVNCLSSKVVNFRETWTKDLAELDAHIKKIEDEQKKKTEPIQVFK